MAGLATEMSGKVVIITGASGGLGRATAIEFAKQEACLVISGRNEKELEITKECCLQTGKIAETQILQIIADLDEEQECKKIVAEAVAKFGKIDVLVNNAARLIPGSIESSKLEDFDAHVKLNCRSVFVLTQEAVPYLKVTKGNIVNISSICGLRNVPGLLSYSICKSALDHLTRSVALELAPFGVRVNSVLPGSLPTNMVMAFCNDESQIDQVKEAFIKNHPVGRLGETDEVSKSIVFLASNSLSSFTTGANLSVDGGFALMCAR